MHLYDFDLLLKKVCELDAIGRDINYDIGIPDHGLGWLYSKCDISRMNKEEKKEILSSCKIYIERYNKYKKESDIRDLTEYRYRYRIIFSKLFPYIKEPLHEKWRDYSEEEIYETHKQKCKTCWYAARNIADSGKIISCDYILRTGMMRNSSPEICEHYTTKEDKPRVKFGI